MVLSPTHVAWSYVLHTLHGLKSYTRCMVLSPTHVAWS